MNYGSVHLGKAHPVNKGLSKAPRSSQPGPFFKRPARSPFSHLACGFLKRKEKEKKLGGETRFLFNRNLSEEAPPSDRSRQVGGGGDGTPKLRPSKRRAGVWSPRGFGDADLLYPNQLGRSDPKSVARSRPALKPRCHPVPFGPLYSPPRSHRGGEARQGGPFTYLWRLPPFGSRRFQLPPGPEKEKESGDPQDPQDRQRQPSTQPPHL